MNDRERKLHQAARLAGAFQTDALAQLDHGTSPNLHNHGRQLATLLFELGFLSNHGNEV